MECSLQEDLFHGFRRLSVFLTLLVFLLPSFFAKANAQDTLPAKADSLTTKQVISHSPRRATIYSMVLPGLGQAYNHKYWKIPIVYAGFGTMYYFIRFNTKYYHDFRDAYDYKTTIFPPDSVSPLPAPPNDLVSKYDVSQLLRGREYYRRNLEVSYIFTGVWYILTIVDATVDAHFFDYDINEDLSLNVRPWMPALNPKNQPSVSVGINLTLHF